MYGVSSDAKQPPSADADDIGTVYGDATYGGTPASPPTTEEEEGAQTIGPYRLVKMLGEGGMGQVWLAAQTFPVRRKVALKLIKGGKYDKSVIQRFEAERQSLAIMDHPAIAKVFDAGTTSEGQPFFVMEYVPGSPITKYCDEKRLSTRERLNLFIKVCEGVQHAHQKAMIHRDLKPGNILVSEIDGKPAPHIIDFGIAKATENKQEGETLLTQAGMLVGTPGYMAPEQTDPSFPDIDTRADVYALGVILYELLTGSPCLLTPSNGKSSHLYEVLRRIREDDPPRPSTQLITLNDTAAEQAGLRQTEPRQLASLLKGDLDWITMKALEKDRARRYDSPTSLAADITRYLTDEPVLASPPSVSYRTSKFIKRHRVGVLAAALYSYADRAGGFHDRAGCTASRESATAPTGKPRKQRVFPTFSLTSSTFPTPARRVATRITAREILDQGAKQVETKLTGQPEVQARLLATIGKRLPDAGTLFPSPETSGEIYQLRRRVLGPKNPELLSSLNDLAYVLMIQGKSSAAEKLARDALPIDRSALGPENPVTISCMIELGSILRDEGRFEEAEKLTRETLEIQKRVLGPENPETLRSMSNLGFTLGEEGRLKEAEAMLRESYDIRRKVMGPDHPETLRDAYFLAGYLSIDNQLDEAEKLQRETLELRRHVLGDEHIDTLNSMEALANTLQSEKHYAEAEKLRRDVLGVQRRVLGPEHPLTLSTMTELANNLSVQGRYKDADALLEETLAIQKRVRGVNNPDTAETEYNLACNAALGGHKAEALALLKEAFEHGLSPLNKKHMAEDPDLKSLHGNPEFEALVAEGQKSGGSE